MIIRLNITKWDGKNDQRITDTTTGNVFLFNAKNINGPVVRASTKSSFMFVENRNDYRAKAEYLEATQSTANIQTYAAYTINSEFVSLPLYPDNDITQSVVTTMINVDSISWVYKDGISPKTKCHIVFFEGGKRRDVLSSYSINQVYSLIDDANLTTT